MSYCRFSSDNWRSDVYAYADVSGGYTTHVACNRVVGEIPPDPLFMGAEYDAAKMDEHLRLHRKCMEFLDTAERAPIGLPHDGATFRDPDLPSFIDRLESLRAAGYNVPQCAIDGAREELADEAWSLRSSPSGEHQNG